MAGYDATGALGDIFSGLEAPQPDQAQQDKPQSGKPQNGEMEAVAARTDSILDARPTEPFELVLNLARGLPDLADVQEVADDDTSELTETEQRQKGETENIIRGAAAAGEAAIWVIAEGLQRAAKGRWWRSSHPTYEQYVYDLTGRSASYVRRLRAGAPLALETAARTGLVQNPGQNRETRKAEQQHGKDAAILLFQVVTEVTEELGDKVTAETLRAARLELPAALPAVPEQQRAEIEQSTRKALGQGVPIDTPPFEENSNNGVPIDTPDTKERPAQTQAAESEQGGDGDGDDILDAEIVPDPTSIVALNDAIAALNALNRAVTKDTFVQAAKEAEPHEYAELRAQILKKATTFQKKALHAPRVYGHAPTCETCGTEAIPSPQEAGLGKAGAYWWCETCKTTQGDRKPL
ncbi:hypothetical protein AB0M05_41365 [Streptomyces violaceusniger]|uniref:hypothetical protein n=1 Tax=Streptomyces violaceusniger TaxID=68280 RepID=UPI00343A63E8